MSARTSGLVMGVAVLAKLAAMVREIVIAAAFGASSLTDAYGIAMILPNLAVTLVSSSLSAIAVPFFMEDQREQERLRMARALLLLTTLLLFVFSVLLWFLGPVFLRFLLARMAPQEPQEMALLLRFFTIMVLPSSFAALASARLYAQRRFGAASAAPAVGTVATTLGIVLLPHSTAALGGSFAAGAILQWLTVAIFMPGPLLVPAPDFAKAFAIWRVMLPQMMSGAVGQVNLLVDRVFASQLIAGSIAELTFASRVLDIPVSVFAQALVTTLYPDLAAAAARADDDAYVHLLTRDLRRVVAVTLPLTVWLLAAAVPVTAILFGHGHYSAHATAITAGVLQAYAPLLVFRSAQSLTARAFYAQKDTLTLGRLSLVALPVNVILDYVFLQLFGLSGIAAATTLVGAAYAAAALLLLARRFDGVFAAMDFARLARFAAVVAAWLIVALILAPHIDALQALPALILWLLFGLLHIVLVRQLMGEEWSWLCSMVRTR